MLSFKPAFAFSFFTFIKKLFNSSPLFCGLGDIICVSEVIAVSSGILIPACALSNPAFHMMYSAYKLNKQGDNIQTIHSFPSLEPVCCSMPSSDCCFLTCIKVSQEAGQVVWSSHLFQNFPQYVVIHTVKGFSRVSEAEVDVFLEFFFLFSLIQWMLAI